jgi:hypothetical protein
LRVGGDQRESQIRTVAASNDRSDARGLLSRLLHQRSTGELVLAKNYLLDVKKSCVEQRG